MVEAVVAAPSLVNDISTIDILIGADHGQGALRAVTKFILQDRNKKILVKQEYSLAEVQCKKDNSDLVNRTIGPHINNALKRIVRYVWDADTGLPVSDGTFSFF